MKRINRSAVRRLTLAVTAILAGGTTFASCDTRFKTAVVGGTKDFIFTLMDPAYILANLAGESSSDDESSP